MTTPKISPIGNYLLSKMGIIWRLVLTIFILLMLAGPGAEILQRLALP